MRQLTQTELEVWINAAEAAARQLKEAITAEQIYVATGVATSSISYERLTKAFQAGAAQICELDLLKYITPAPPRARNSASSPRAA